MIDGMKKNRTIHLALAAAMMVAPLAQATESVRIQVAAAIGDETKPAVPPRTKPATRPTAPQTKTPPQTTTAQPTPAKPAALPVEEGLSTTNWIWIGVGAAALLAAAGGGGGGGGGGGSSTPSH